MHPKISSGSLPDYIMVWGNSEFSEFKPQAPPGILSTATFSSSLPVLLTGHEAVLNPISRYSLAFAAIYSTLCASKDYQHKIPWLSAWQPNPGNPSVPAEWQSPELGVPNISPPFVNRHQEDGPLPAEFWRGTCHYCRNYPLVLTWRDPENNKKVVSLDGTCNFLCLGPGNRK